MVVCRRAIDSSASQWSHVHSLYSVLVVTVIVAHGHSAVVILVDDLAFEPKRPRRTLGAGLIPRLDAVSHAHILAADVQCGRRSQ